MMVDLPYGKGSVRVNIPEQAKVAYPREVPAVTDPRAEIRRAMDDPIECEPLRRMAQDKSDVTIVINDITRPAPSGLMLEEILADLEKARISRDAVTVVIAYGNHRPNRPDEIEEMVGPELMSRLRIVHHDCKDGRNLTFLGNTDRGLPIWVNTGVANASLKIVTGIITPHQSAGFSGGRKSITPGVAGLITLNRHHSFPIRPYQPSAGWMKDNPFHEEAVQAARMAGVDFILNVVKNYKGQVVKAVAGELEAAHDHGVSVCAENWAIELPQRYEIVVVTPGGYPRDIDLHQAQKAMSTAETIIEDGGVIVLVAECADGIGKFADWLKDAATPREVIERFKREGFTQAHSSKAFMFARALERCTVIVCCSGVDRADLEQMFLGYASSPQAAIEQALELKGPKSSTLVLPYAVDTLPRVAPEPSA